MLRKSIERVDHVAYQRVSACKQKVAYRFISGKNITGSFARFAREHFLRAWGWKNTTKLYTIERAIVTGVIVGDFVPWKNAMGNTSRICVDIREKRITTVLCRRKQARQA